MMKNHLKSAKELPVDQFNKALRDEVIMIDQDRELRTCLSFLGPMADVKSGKPSDLYEPLDRTGIQFIENKLPGAIVPSVYRKIKYSPTDGFDLIEPNFQVH